MLMARLTNSLAFSYDKITVPTVLVMFVQHFTSRLLFPEVLTEYKAPLFHCENIRLPENLSEFLSSIDATKRRIYYMISRLPR